MNTLKPPVAPPAPSKNTFEKSKSVAPYSRYGSEEPSLTVAPARLRSVDRDINNDNNNRYQYSTRQWRSRLIREQQLADNRRLLDSVRSRCSPEKQSTFCSQSPRRYPYALNVKINEREQNPWDPIHNSAINKHKNINDNNNVNRTTADLISKEKEIDKNNNLINSRISPLLPRKFLKTEDEPKIEPKIEIEQDKKILRLTVRERYAALEALNAPVLSLKDRKDLAESLTSYLNILHADLRETPGYDHPLGTYERLKEGVDCDTVFENIILGNGGTVKKKDYLKRIGVTHVLNAAEYRGVNVTKDYYNQRGDNFQYFGVRIEDTPQTQICR